MIAVLAVLYALGSSASPSAPGQAVIGSASLTDTAGVTDLPASSEAPSAKPTAAPTPHPTSRATARPVAACKPTDQDRYIYRPSRLDLLRPCILVTGTVAAIRIEADGDLHILLALDPAYQSLLRPANQGEELGDLVVEPVCVRSVTQSDAIAICRSDPDPYAGAFPEVGEHIWMEGRYALDLEHGSWAELHPLYR